MQIKLLSDFPQAQRDRLAFIEFRLWFLGDVSRKDLMERFSIAPAVATRDLAAYRELSSANIAFDGRHKIYVLGEHFSPLFEHQSERVLSVLSRGFGGGSNERSEGYLPCELPFRLNRPSLSVLAVISRAIHQGKVVRVTYHSRNKEPSERDIVPFAIVDSGIRWHVRGFDRRSKEFRDLVITRIEDPILLDGEVVAAEEGGDQDDQWTRRIRLQLVPHPYHKRPEVVALDLGMKDGVLEVYTRAAIAGYILQMWNVDCSKDYSLDPMLHRLALADPLVLHQVSSAVLAPGFSGQNE